MSKEIEKIWGQLKTQKDELRVQAHLARAELREELEELEGKWQKAEQKFSRIQDNAIETTLEMKDSAKVIMQEISVAHDRIKQRLDD
ncbi:MAG: hypothetical protein ACI9LO_002572 [Planctomycetota bacterium]|jgi:DNA repair exonuclease SbcCD ATPase subunit